MNITYIKKMMTIVFLLGMSNVFAAKEIHTCVELQNINQDLSAHYVLTNDIDCSGVQFNPIGTSANPFAGRLEGAGFKISYLNIIPPQGSSHVGLFGVTSYATISQLTLENVNVKGENYVGALIGMAQRTRIINVSSSGNIQGEYFGTLHGENIGGLVGGLLDNSAITQSHSSVNISVGVSPYFYVGGLVGYAKNSAVSRSNATGNVNATTGVGGLIGVVDDSSVSYSYATGPITIEGKYTYPASAGGLIGVVSSSAISSTINNSYATGGVNSQYKVKIDRVGGLIGNVVDFSSPNQCSSSKKTTKVFNSFATGAAVGYYSVGGLVGQSSDTNVNVTNSYSTGNVSGTGRVGGLVGYLTCFSSVTHSYWDKQTSGQNTSGGGEGKTTAEMYRKVTYVDWDFDTMWQIEEAKGSPNFIPNLHIKNCVDLQNIQRNLNAQYILDNDIDCSGKKFFSIGDFSGVLNGNGFVISNMTSYSGLFSTTKNALIEHLHFKNVNMNAYSGAGALAGVAESTSILDVTASGTIVAQSSITQAIPTSIGGLVGGLYDSVLSGGVSSVNINPQDPGKNYFSKWTGGLVGSTGNSFIEKSHATGQVSGYWLVGGLVGAISVGTITDSYASGRVTAQYQGAGGLIGLISGNSVPLINRPAIFVANTYATGAVASSSNSSGGLIGMINICKDCTQKMTVLDSFATGVTMGNSDVGGLIGGIYAKSPGFSLINSYSSGAVVAAPNGQAGGLVGSNSSEFPGSMSNSYWDIQTSGQTSPSCGANTGAAQCGVGKLTNEMYQQETFVNWDFNQIWNIDQNKNYPCLKGLSCPVFKKIY